MAGAYSYQPLNGAKKTRLLVLQPCKVFSDDLTAELREISLEDPTVQYEALSYVWGTSQGSVQITCQGRSIAITPNCASALRYLRRTRQPRALWVDAVCIDQNNILERNDQVWLMGGIYKKAQRVYIWLGEEFSDEGTLFRQIKYLSRVLKYIGPLRGAFDEGFDTNVFNEKRKKPLLGDNRTTEAFGRLCGNAWFERVWTLQEYAFARDAIFKSGHHECTPTQLQSCYRYFIPLLGASTRQLAQKAHFRSEALLAFRSLFGNLGEQRYAQKIAKVERVPMLRAYALAHLLNWSRGDKATDPRDKLYSVLPLITDIFGEAPEFPKVDYSKPVEVIYAEFSRHIILHSGDLSILCCHTSNKEVPNLPSWVPDWSLQIGIRDIEHAKICQLAPPVGIPDSNVHWADRGPREIGLQGESIGTVSFLGPRYPDRSTAETPEEFGEQLKLFDEVCQTFIQKCYNPAGRHTVDMKWGIVNRLIHPEPGPQAERSNFILFAMTNGRIGASRAHPEPGDTLALFFGGYSPYIVRSQGGGSYEYIGMAVLQDMGKGNCCPKKEDVDKLSTFFLV